MTDLTRTLSLTRPMLRGEDVLWVQTRLATGGWPAAIATATRSLDGLFGPATETAIRAFQTLCNLKPDGIVGPETWSRLRLGPSAPAAAIQDARRAAEAATAPARILSENIATLRQPHRRFAGGTPWRLDATGVIPTDAPILVTAAHRDRARLVLTDWFGTPLRRATATTGVPLSLLAATLCTESAGGAASRDAAARAERREPGFLSETATPHRISVGCMQTLVSTAAQALGRPVIAAELTDPAIAIEAGAAYIAQQAGRTLLDPPAVACAYNAGSVRLQDSPGNRWKMLQYPIGTGHHADRFCAYFNAALDVLHANGEGEDIWGG